MEGRNDTLKIQDQWFVVIGIVLIASTLRAPLTAVGPVIDNIQSHLHINHFIAGFITTIPLIIFGLVSMWVTRILKRFEMTHILFVAVIVTIIGLVIRISGDLLMFVIGTIIIGVSIAFCNVTLPAYAKQYFPLQIGLITGIYSATMNFTAGLGGGLSYPLSQVSDWDYRLSLSFWVVFAVVAILFWLPQLKVKVKAASQRDEPHAYPIIKSKLAWAVALLMAFQSMSFYCIVAWYPSILISKGISPETAGYMLMLNQFAQLPMTFTFPIIAAKMKNQRRLIQMITLLFLIGFSLLWSQHVMLLVLAMIFSGLAIGACFSLCMTLFSIRAKTTQGSMQLSGFGQSVGYWIAAIGPFLMGALYDYSKNWNSAIVMFLIMTVIICLVGHYATRATVIEDEFGKQ
ncbi:MFS transporter [Staphylococcus chromogenes]|uniref:CynX/NimT family MFS transporter n=1 Tax=Staphylococcus chromogenes TaxID=46126 RepID=UPI001404CC1F|nr:MFS transporter [Staphylococcus chromogenes]QIN25937.1 MFS transporter [Staphylococcus chromogenes]